MIPCYPSSHQQQQQQQLPMFAPTSGNPNATNPADQSLMLLQATEAFFGHNNNHHTTNVEPTPINPSAPVQVGDVGPHNKELELSDMLDFSFTSMDDLNDEDDDLPLLFGNHHKNSNNGMAPSVVSNSDLFKTAQQQNDSSSLFSLLTTKQQDTTTMPTMMRMTNMPQASTTMTLSASAVVHTKKRSSAELISEDEESCQSSNKKTKTLLTNDTINNDDQQTVNMSTRHIQALCSDKGPALCHDIIDCAEPADTSHMTEQEKTLASKDRNRMHARNTRIRKKAYVDLLKTTLLQVCAQRDTTHTAQRQHEQSQLETRTVRFSYAQELLQCKARHEPNVQRWKVVADEAISVRVSGGSNASAVGLPHVVLGHWMPHELLADSAAMIRCDRGSLLMDGDFCVLDWTCGMHVRGTIKCQFHPVTNKIVHAHLVVANTTAATSA